ncbi:isoprenylcysteine carboxylmethyltransferase family protein [Pseudomaricurvus sp. HS19]|uniref:methyltransferase family protein n=1 Tax=Pseudomaricurvus sp. HS19 TaxID=2692626 RepID=UPI00136E618C|nr:methyltransferase [Pseudomaricurvus sp. HS19]MYM63970.1 DUF1295 domain-containing protein [Pseudomaricurvus sp. HS19]
MSLTTLSFGGGSLLLAWLCRQQLRNPACHGFYRFFAFVGVLWLLLQALPVWHAQLFSLRQLLSLLLMLSASGLLVSGLLHLRRARGQGREQQAIENFAFENTEHLITTGIYGYIRHPMYSALLAFNWGLYLKQPGMMATLVALLVTLALYLTARFEEEENCQVFGDSYQAYRTRSKRFLPLLW